MTTACIILGIYAIVDAYFAVKMKRVHTILTWPFDLFILWLAGRYM